MKIERLTAAFSPWDLKDLEAQGEEGGEREDSIEEGSGRRDGEEKMQMQKMVKPEGEKKKGTKS